MVMRPMTSRDLRRCCEAVRSAILAVALMLQSVVCLSVTLCIVAKRCVLEQKLLLTAYIKSYTKNLFVANE